MRSIDLTRPITFEDWFDLVVAQATLDGVTMRQSIRCVIFWRRKSLNASGRIEVGGAHPTLRF
jgi:hypothetical protein